ncbi:hypothetical protein K439DRAFT_1123654 [Ramaria rubella]|nr:hypothetical protein K439DRAFT_1123654 [Ramaria rubella]
MNADVVAFEPPRFPVETWESIFLNVTRPGDLYNVSLTSRYIHDIVKPILYRQLYLDPNHYSIYTLSRLKREPELIHRVAELTLLAPVFRDIPTGVRREAEHIYNSLDIPHAPSPLPAYLCGIWSPLGIQPVVQLSGMEVEMCSRPILHLFPAFTGLTSLRIVKDCVPSDFFHWVFQLPQLTTLDIRDSMVSTILEQKVPQVPLPLRNLTIVRCWTKADVVDNYVPGKLCEGLIRHSPSLTSLTIDLFVERAACHVLSDLETPPPIQQFTCHGMGHHDPDCVLLCSVLVALPTITSLNMNCTPRELALILPADALPNLTTLTGQVKSIAIFFGMHRPLEYLTITDAPVLSGGGTPWETQLIQFLELVNYSFASVNYTQTLRNLKFNVHQAPVWTSTFAYHLALNFSHDSDA